LKDAWTPIFGLAILITSGDLFAEVTAGSGEERIAAITKTVSVKIGTRPRRRSPH
jgi:hypothetical protein